MGLNPVRVVQLGQASHPTIRKFSFSGTPMPQDIFIAIREYFNNTIIGEDEITPIYQLILSQSESASVEHIKEALQKLTQQLKPTDRQMVEKVRDYAVKELESSDIFQNMDRQRDIISKELPVLEKQAQETGDWRFFLRASEKKEALSEAVHTE